MPGGDGTGPGGMGPMSGRAAGYCAGYASPGYANPAPVGGFWGGGRGRGGFARGGWGRRNQYYATGMTGWQRAGMGMPAYGAPVFQPAPYSAATVSREQQLEALKTQAEHFKAALENIQEQIETLQVNASEKSE